MLTLGFDTVRAYPVIILALAIGPIFGGGMVVLVVLVGLLVATSMPYYGRIMRASVMAQAKSEYVEALCAMGAGRVRIVARHILPNVIGPVLIVASMDIPTFIAAEAGHSFLGVGAKPPASSWGLMLRCGFDFVGYTPWLVVAAYTRDGAWAEFNEHRKGRQRVDMMADVVVMDRDLEVQRAGQLSLAQAALTVCGGQITFEA
ncbi:ABC transporter permease [Phaeobacter porticola]|uniref:Putative glutathione transport system permease protein n=1 Tax=Phaeobacter porticola TaxID=1844006 RepID=A0A1L3I0H7_9RHOB|nr:ABC transporter permease subunit [Phaeobacter porticola]APG45629.1 putative glutathione transport system permease protein [Phaeobacter porticola]